MANKEYMQLKSYPDSIFNELTPEARDMIATADQGGLEIFQGLNAGDINLLAEEVQACSER